MFVKNSAAFEYLIDSAEPRERFGEICGEIRITLSGDDKRVRYL